MSPVSQPHDRLFRALMERPESAAALLLEHLPPAIAGRLAPDTLERLPGTFIDDALRTSQTDVLFRVRTTEGEPALIYALVEHKSRPAPRVALQILRYMIRIWSGLGPEWGSAPLPVIVPLVVYHGAEPWNVPGRFAGLFTPDPVLYPCLPDFAYALADLGQIDDHALSAERITRGVLRALKYAFREAGQRAALQASAADVAGDMVFVRLVFSYMIQVFEPIDRAALQEAVRRAAPLEENRLMSIFGEEMKALGRAEGLAMGKAEGRMEGKAETLLRLLQRRFGPVPEGMRARVLAAEAGQLDVWLDNILDAPDLDSVFRAMLKRSPGTC